MSSKDLKVGDRVKLTKAYKKYACGGSDTGVIVSIEPYNAVKFDGCELDGHKERCNRFYRDTECFELLIEAPKTEEYKQAAAALDKWMGNE